MPSDGAPTEGLCEMLRGSADTLLVECPGEVLSEARAERLRGLADVCEHAGIEKPRDLVLFSDKLEELQFALATRG